MKNILIFTILLFIGFLAEAQNKTIISGQLIDNNTKEPLPYGNIIYPVKSLGTISNIDGYFTFSLTDAQKNDSIIISYIGYKPIRTTISDCLENDIFKLKPQVNKIAPVDVKAKKFKLKTFMKEVIAEYNKNKKKDPHIAIAHYREKAKFDGRYVMYMESLGISVFSGNRVDAVPLSNYKFFCEDSRCSAENPKWMSHETRVATRIEGKVSNAGGANLNVFRCFEISGILSVKNSKKYNFKIDSSYFINNNQVISINFKKGESNGTIHVISESKKIVKIECSTKNLWSTKYKKRVRANVNIQFNYFNNAPYISSIVSYYEKDGYEHFNTLTILVQKFNEFQLSKKEYWSINNYSYNPYIIYHQGIWQNFTIPIDDDYKKIESDLATNKFSLEEQFVNFSGQWFFPNKSKSELARKTILKLKSNF